MMKLRIVPGIFAFSLMVSLSHGQYTFPGCTNLVASDFRKVVLVDKSNYPAISEPVKMAFASDGRMFFVERSGKVLLYQPSTKTVTQIGSLDVDFVTQEMGLTGITLHPDFANKPWIYLYYAPKCVETFRVSRFNFTAGKIDSASEKILLDIPHQRKASSHTGGAMAFDAQGHLWISVGNNTANGTYVDETDPNKDDQRGSANTNSLLGKILRITPTDDGKYTIPTGNLFPTGAAKTRPEIYAMGLRNPYTLNVDKYKGWLTWGDVGPDDGLGKHEEYNLTTQPGFMGWPYFAGANDAYRLNKDPKSPVNNSPNNTGLKDLPPAIPAILPYDRSCAISGPIYRYNAQVNSTVKLPPHLDGKWIIADFVKNWFKTVTVDSLGKTVIKEQNVFTGLSFTHPLDVQLGPDDALYVLEFATWYELEYSNWFPTDVVSSISRVEYIGSCKSDMVPQAILAPEKTDFLPKGGLTYPGPNRRVALPIGIKGLEVYDLKGSKIWEYRRSNADRVESLKLPAEVDQGVLQVKLIP